MASRDLRPVLARAGIVVACAVVVLALFLLLESSRRNGHRLDEALDELAAQRRVNARLLVKVERQGERIRGQTVRLRELRDALRDAGINPDRVLTRAESRHGGPPAESGGTTGTPHDAAPPGRSDRPSRADDRGGGPTPPPDGPSPGAPGPPQGNPPEGDRPRCRVVDPLTGRCLLRRDDPRIPLVPL